MLHASLHGNNVIYLVFKKLFFKQLYIHIFTDSYYIYIHGRPQKIIKGGAKPKRAPIFSFKRAPPKYWPTEEVFLRLMHGGPIERSFLRVMHGGPLERSSTRNA